MSIVTSTMNISIEFDVDCTYIGSAMKPCWKGIATIFGHEIAELPEHRGRSTKKAAIEALKILIRENNA